MQLYPTNCEIYGPTIVMEQLFKNLGKWESENDRAVWNVDVPKAGVYAVVLNYASSEDEAGNGWLLEAGDSKLSGTIESTGSKDRYQEIEVGQIELPAGEQQIVLHSSGPIQGNLMQFGGLLLKPLPRAAK